MASTPAQHARDRGSVTAEIAVALPAVVVVLAACLAEEGPAQPTAGSCGDDVPQLDWESFGEGFVTTYCQGCHAAGAFAGTSGVAWSSRTRCCNCARI